MARDLLAAAPAVGLKVLILKASNDRKIGVLAAWPLAARLSGIGRG